MKRILCFLIVGVMLASLVACSSSEPCELCGEAPTRGYKVDGTDEKQYYCSACSSECFFCGEKATKHYTSMAGIIVFACDECYEEMHNAFN